MVRAPRTDLRWPGKERWKDPDICVLLPTSEGQGVG